MHLSYRYRLYPFKDQEAELDRHLVEMKGLWNHALAEREDAWQSGQRRVTYSDQQASLTRWRRSNPGGLGRVSCTVAQGCLQRLDLAYAKAFSRLDREKAPGFPRFKSYVSSLSFGDARKAHLARGRNGSPRLHLPNIGDVPLELHRQPPESGLKSCVVGRDGSHWMASLLYEIPDPPPPSPAPPQRPVGVDLGLESLLVLSTGAKVPPPKFRRAAERRIAREQHRLSRKRKGSQRWLKQRSRLATVHAKVQRQRADHAHKVTTALSQSHDMVAFEALPVDRMIRTCFSRPISDAGWGLLRSLTDYKMRLRSGRCVQVPAAGTSQRCSVCDERATRTLELKDRVFECPNGHVEDRDVNAARNVLKRGLQTLRGNTADVKPVERGPTLPRKRRRVYSMKREPHSNGSPSQGRPSSERDVTTWDMDPTDARTPKTATAPRMATTAPQPELGPSIPREHLVATPPSEIDEHPARSDPFASAQASGGSDGMDTIAAEHTSRTDPFSSAENPVATANDPNKPHHKVEIAGVEVTL